MSTRLSVRAKLFESFFASDKTIVLEGKGKYVSLWLNFRLFVSCISGAKFEPSDSRDREASDSGGVSERVIGRTKVDENSRTCAERAAQ